MPHVAEFSIAHRDIDLRIETTTQGIPERDRADVTVALTRRVPDYVLSERLFPIRYIPAGSAPEHERLADQGLDALEHTTLLLHQARPHAWHQWAESAGLPPSSPCWIIRLDNMFALARATEQGAGIALIPTPIGRAWFTSGAFRRLFCHDLVTADYYWVGTSSGGDHDEQARLVWRWMVDTFANEQRADDT